MLCIGPITKQEAALINGDAEFCDGYGFYLYVADASKPNDGIEVLAKITSPEAARNLSSLLSLRL
jgi:hypothetical protein